MKHEAFSKLVSFHNHRCVIKHSFDLQRPMTNEINMGIYELHSF